MVGVGQGALPGLGRRQLLAVPVQDLGQHAYRIFRLASPRGQGRDRQGHVCPLKACELMTCNTASTVRLRKCHIRGKIV